MVETARFENAVLTSAENRLVDAIATGLLPASLKDELDTYVRACRAAADRMDELAHAPPPPNVDAFQLALDEFTAAIGPIAQANANAVQTKRVTLHFSAKDGPPKKGGHVPPNVSGERDASQFNVPSPLPATK